MFDWRSVYPGTVTVTLVLDRDEAAALIDAGTEQGRKIGRDTLKGLPDGWKPECEADAKSESVPASGEDLDAWNRLGGTVNPGPGMAIGQQVEKQEAFRAIALDLAWDLPQDALPSLFDLVTAVEDPEPEPAVPGPREGEDKPSAAILLFTGVRRERIEKGGAEEPVPPVAALPIPANDFVLPGEAAAPLPPVPARRAPAPFVRKPVRMPKPSKPVRTGLEPGLKALHGQAGPAGKPVPRPVAPRPVEAGPLRIKTVDPQTRALIDAAIAAGKVTKCPPCTFAIDATDTSQSHWHKHHARIRANRIEAKRRQLAARQGAAQPEETDHG